MSSTEINYSEFIKYVHTHFEPKIDLDGVKEILHLEEDYNKDSPASLGKSLVLNRLIFSGTNKGGEEFIHDQKLYTGINVWIADNFKGKSSIFKIVKFALTGIESYKPDVKGWIDEIILEFQIGKAIYTIFIDKRGRDKGMLFSFDIDKFNDLRANQKLDTIEKEREFDFKSKKMLEEHMQEFFFDHFSFYTLKYTSKNSSKDSFELSTANLSWATYFKSIYLESSNYEYLFFDNENFGAQGRKIFEMILGLPLTYPINMLGVQADKVSEEIGKLKLTDKSRVETTKADQDKIQKRYDKVLQDLKKLREGGKIRFDDKPLTQEYTQIQERVSETRKEGRAASETYQTEREKQTPLEAEIRNLENDRGKITNEINRLSKLELNVELYKEAGSFFSNLDIKVCPHCDVKVTEDRKENEIHTHECSLCGETSTEQKVEEEELQAKLGRIKEEKEGHQKKLDEIQKSIAQQKSKASALKISIAALYNKAVAVPSVDADNKRLKEIEARIEAINKERKSQQKLINQEQELIKDEAVLKFQIEEIKKAKTTDNSIKIEGLSLRKDILTYSIDALGVKRKQLNHDILDKLQKLILNEVHAFGLDSIEDIEINEKYDLVLTQNKVKEGFNELAEGEKLRVKIAFYLSLIQLDIDHSLGRHPRFLIFDSPGSEEMIEKDLLAMADFFKKVNERFEGKLQIFVGSALRVFAPITEKKKAIIKGKGEYIF